MQTEGAKQFKSREEWQQSKNRSSNRRKKRRRTEQLALEHSTEMQKESRRHVVVEDNACDDAPEAHEAHESERALHIPNNESPTLSTSLVNGICFC
eukprot:CAMPEP_0179472498 /NCGR_PEP_ID=MMETSP0799-20121207/52482_1 /TAXON_ID=46947 /ORGANISM="Geminigera cryophila, Strain CCMP2564" /LENGTH=95 /DNA_ID=CAMNT_0021280677 /DNA_START=199 /DNA_END=486 /DNA_ORIENTATION=-